MTLISTGGFSILNSNFQNYSSWIQLAGILIMIIGGINFAVHYHVIREGKINALWKNAQQRNLYFIIFCGGVLIYLLNLWSGSKIPCLDTLFEWTSALTTCGLTTLTLNRFSSMGKLFLILGMFAGACAGSTAGGLKIQRLMHLFSGITLRVKTITEDKEQTIMKAYDPSTPQEQEPKEVDLPRNETTEKLYAAGVLFFLWMLTVVLGWLFMLK